MADFDAAYAPTWSPKIPRTYSTPFTATGQVTPNVGSVAGDVSPFPPLLLGRSLSHAPAGDAIAALFQPGVFQFQPDPQPRNPITQEKSQACEASEPITLEGSNPLRGRQAVALRWNEVGLCQELGASQLEQCMARCRNEVEAVAAKCRAAGQKFDDPAFPASKASLGSGNFAGSTIVTWQRASEVEGDKLRSGHFGAVHLQGALATMQSMGIDPRGLIVWREPDVGVYGARFFKDGEWIYEVLDDLIPCQNGLPLFGFCGQDWPLIEKAYAKVHGSYEASSCPEEDALEDVLGAAGSRISVSDFPVWAELWQHLRGKHKRGLALAAVRRRELAGEVLTSGLLGGCAYPIRSLDQINGQALVALENPWPQGRWNGRWGPDSMEALRCGRAPGCNSFWMSIQDFCQHFTDVAEARVVPASWESAMVSMSDERPSYPLVSVASNAQAIFSVTQADSRLRDRSFAPLGLRVYRCRIVAPPQHATGAKQNVSNPFKPLELLAEKVPSKVHSVMIEVPKLEPNCLYVASICSPEGLDFAALRVHSSTSMRFRELSVPESAYFLQAEEQAMPTNESFSSQGSVSQVEEQKAVVTGVTDSRGTADGSVSDGSVGSEPGDCDTDLGFGDLKLPPFLQDMLKHCSAVDC